MNTSVNTRVMMAWVVAVVAVLGLCLSSASGVQAAGERVEVVAREPTAEAGTITLSTYVFALIAVGSCIVGSVFSYVIGKVIDTIKEA